MIESISRYLSLLGERFGAGWNRFWFTPADPLPLAVIRVLSGAIALYWYLTLVPDLEKLLGPGGWLSIETVQKLEGSFAAYQWSYWNYVDNTAELWTVYAIGGAVLLAATVGWFTRVTVALAWIVVLSTVHRTTPLSSQVEWLLTTVMFYLMLGPSGACLSLDSRRAAQGAPTGAVLVAQTSAGRDSMAAGVVIRLLQVHLAMLYGCMGLSKLLAEHWWIGMGVWPLITRGDSRLVNLTWLHKHPFVVNFWSHAIVIFELSFAVLIWNQLARPLLLAIAVVMWCSLTLLTGQVTFLLLMLVANLAFAPVGALRACLPKAAVPRATPA